VPLYGTGENNKKGQQNVSAKRPGITTNMNPIRNLWDILLENTGPVPIREEPWLN